MRNFILKSAVSAAAILVAVNVHATVSTVTMGLTGSFPYDQTGFTASLAGTGQIISTDDLIGLYGFNVTAQSGNALPSIGPTLYTVCLSPLGVLNNNTAQNVYDAYPNTSATISANSYPSSLWSTPPGYGMMNAQYLYNTLSGQILGGGIAGQTGGVGAQGAALALAMYTALYNSTGYGITSGTALTIGGLTGDTLADYTADITALVNSGIKSNSLPSGSVLIPESVLNNYSGAQNGPDGQEMIVMTSLTPQGRPVPEASTIISGVLLLLPFGAGMIRIMRKKAV